MLIGIDIDGVIFPWADVANEALVRRFGIADPGPHTSWFHIKDTIAPEHWEWLWTKEGQEVVFSQSSPVYDGVVEAILALLKAGHEVHFVTHRDPRRTAIHTARYLDRHFGKHPWGGLHIVQNATEKADLLDWDVFVDDKPETVTSLLVSSDAHVFMPDRPWNQELVWKGVAEDEDDIVGFTRYTAPAQIVRWVEETELVTHA